VYRQRKRANDGIVDLFLAQDGDDIEQKEG
jgi:hypothetical protein